MKKILIIGGCGYIGSSLFPYLKQKKYSVDTVDSEMFGNVTNPKNIKMNYGKLSKRFLNNYGVVILLAGHSTVSMCESDVSGSLKNNLINFVDLLEKLSNQKFIYASSFRVYGDTGKKSASEKDVKGRLLKHYDITKKAIDDIAALSKVNYFSLRMATMNGYAKNFRINQMINQLYMNGINNKKIVIYNPKDRRSILGINDFSRSIKSIIENEAERGTYNLASYNSTIYEIGKTISDLLKIDLEINKQSLSNMNTVIDTHKFEKTFNFEFKESTKSIVESLIKNKAHRSKLISDKKI